MSAASNSPPRSHRSKTQLTSSQVLKQGTLIAASLSTQKVANALEELAHHAKGVCLVGPPGSGRASWAKYLHTLSGPPNRPFVVHQTLRARKRLLYSEDSAFERAREGTLVIDTPGGLSPDDQEALRAALQSSHVPRVVCIDPVGIKGQLVVGLAELIGTVHLYLKPLHQRHEDLRAFLEHRMKQLGLPDIGAALEKWLDNVPAHLGFQHMVGAFVSPRPEDPPEKPPQSTLRAAILEDLLLYFDGDIDTAAKCLGQSPKTLFIELAEREVPLPE